MSALGAHGGQLDRERDHRGAERKWIRLAEEEARVGT